MAITTLLTRTLTTLALVAGLAAAGRVGAAEPPARPATGGFSDKDYAPPPASSCEFIDFYRKRFEAKAGPAFDRTRFPFEREQLAKLERVLVLDGKPAAFPKLGDDYEVLAPSTSHVDMM